MGNEGNAERGMRNGILLLARLQHSFAQMSKTNKNLNRTPRSEFRARSYSGVTYAAVMPPSTLNSLPVR